MLKILMAQANEHVFTTSSIFMRIKSEEELLPILKACKADPFFRNCEEVFEKRNEYDV